MYLACSGCLLCCRGADGRERGGAGVQHRAEHGVTRGSTEKMTGGPGRVSQPGSQQQRQGACEGREGGGAEGREEDGRQQLACEEGGQVAQARCEELAAAVVREGMGQCLSGELVILYHGKLDEAVPSRHVMAWREFDAVTSSKGGLMNT